MKASLISLIAFCMTTTLGLHNNHQQMKALDNGTWIPDRYSTGDDDQLMKNLIEQGIAYTKDPGFTDKY